MKRIIIILIIAVTGAVAQPAKDTPALTAWRGGAIDFNLGLGLNMLGVGTGSATAGGVLSPRLNNKGASIFFNPAELSSLTLPHIVIDSRFGIGTGTFGMEGNALLSDKTLSEQTDEFLKDSSIFLYDKVNGYTLPSKVSSGSAGFLGQLTSFSVGIPIARGLVIGFGSYYPIDINVGFHANDLSMKLRATRETGTQTIGIDFLLNIAISTNLIIRSNVMNAGFGYEVMRNRYGQLSFGVSAKRYDVRTVLDLDMPIDGLISIQKVEYYFNNPVDRAIDFSSGETNALKWKAHGDYRDKKWGYTIGLSYKGVRLIDSALSALNLTLVYDNIPSFSMFDPLAKSESYSPVFMVGKPGGTGQDSMQILIDSLKLSKPNLTKTTHNIFSNRLSLQQSSALTFGIDVGLGKHTLMFNYVKYFGDYSVIFSNYKIGKKLTSGVKGGLDFEMPTRFVGWNWLLLPVRILFLDVDGLLFQAFQSRTRYRNSHYRIGGGVVMGTAIVEGLKPETARDLRPLLNDPIPIGFTMGRQYTIFTRYTIGVMVLGFPDIGFKTSVGIDL